MFFGLTNLPATFQVMMNHLFRDLIHEGSVVIYLNDIMIFTENLDEHRCTTREVLKVLRENKLYLKPEKCDFEKTEVDFLEMVVGNGKVCMDPSKVAAIREWPKPKKKKELQVFLGFTNFY